MIWQYDKLGNKESLQRLKKDIQKKECTEEMKRLKTTVKKKTIMRSEHAQTAFLVFQSHIDSLSYHTESVNTIIYLQMKVN